MQYRIEGEVKARMRVIGPVRDRANLRNAPPGTRGKRLIGDIPLPFDQPRAILEDLPRFENRKRVIEKGEG